MGDSASVEPRAATATTTRGKTKMLKMLSPKMPSNYSELGPVLKTSGRKPKRTDSSKGIK